MICPEISSSLQTEVHSQYRAFTQLSQDQRLMLNDWFEYTWQIRELPVQEHRRGMLQAWALLGFIGRITTGQADESLWLSALLQDEEMAAVFQTVMQNPKSLLRMYAKRFAQVWPVFSSAELEKEGIPTVTADTRAETTTEYMQAVRIHPVPPCWNRHISQSDLPSPDWQHTLLGWQVTAGNCLDPHGFHATEAELRIVTNAFMSLVYFFKEGKIFFETPSMRPDIFDRSQIFSSL